MKKFITLLSLAGTLLGAGSAKAQSFTFQSGDTVYVTTGGTYTSHNNIINNGSTALKVQWKVITNTYPTDWVPTFGICDNMMCYSGGDIAVGVERESLDYPVGTTPGDFHITGDLTGTSGTGPGVVRIRVNNKSIPTDTAIITFIVNKPTASVLPSAKTVDAVQLYPNPATSSVNVVFDEAAEVKTIAIYNIIGKQMSIYRAGGNSANMSVENMPAGVYFVRLINNRGDIVATRKFTKQ